jgi:hypothetical protein
MAKDASEELAVKAHEAAKLFKTKDYAACSVILNELRKRKGNDSKVGRVTWTIG